MKDYDLLLKDFSQFQGFNIVLYATGQRPYCDYNFHGHF